MASLSKSFLNSLCLNPSPESPASTKPETPNHITLQPSIFSRSILKIKQQLQTKPIEKEEEEYMSICFPAYAYANALFFNSAYNVQVVVFDNEPPERLVFRFRSAVFRAGVIQEAKRRRFFETNQDKRKRKARDAARRNRKRRPPPKVSKQSDTEQPKDDDFREDNWEVTDVKVPYC